MLTRILILASGLLASAQLAAQTAATNPSYTTTIEYKATRLENTVNAPVADFAPVRYGDRIYFSSMRQASATDVSVSRIFSYTPGHTPTVDEEFNPKKNTSHIACPTIMPDASRMYYTICRDEAMEDCEIWYRDREYEGGWGVPVKLPESINAHGSNNTQPAIGWDMATKKFTLFFASNRKGGKGKMDIWASTITWNGKFEEPVCLPFNTPEDEVTPSFNQTGQTLYFSSNGLKGRGRFDIFQVKKTNNSTWGTPENMGKTFNTAYDDLFYTYNEASQLGYLASDRPGSQCIKVVEGFGCFDIYEVSKKYVQTPVKFRTVPLKKD